MADNTDHFDISMPSYPNSEDDDPDIFEALYNFGINSPGSGLPESWKDPPVGYVSGTKPTGPRELPSGHYSCPIEGCSNPVGPSEWDLGYTRTDLGPHILSHAGEGDKYYFVEYLRLTVRRRVVAMREDMGCSAEDVINMFYYRGDAIQGLQAKVDDIIMDLAELRGWEQSSRRLGARDEFIDLMIQRAADERSAILQDPRLAKLAGIVPESPHHFRLSWFEDPRETPLETRRNEEVRDPVVVPYDFESSYSPQEIETNFDQSVPRKKARKSQPELDGSDGDSALAGDDDPMGGS